MQKKKEEEKKKRRQEEKRGEEKIIVCKEAQKSLHVNIQDKYSAKIKTTCTFFRFL